MKINLHLLSEKRQTIYKFYKLKFLSNGKPMKKMEDGLVFHPILAPYLINDFLDIYEKKNIKEALDIAVHIANISFKEADLYRGALCFWYDPKDKLSAMPNKFFSGLTQSWYVKASARLSKHNNNFIPTIQLFFNSLLIPIELGGVLVKKDIGWIIEEYPSKPQLYTFNGWLTVLRWLINDEESLKHLPSYYEFLEKNLDAVKHLLPLYDAGFCFNSRYQLTGFTRFRMVFPSDIKFKIEGFSIHIPGDGDFNGSLNKEDVSRGGNYIERNEGRLLQFNIIMSLISYPKVNQFNGSLWTSRKCTVKCFLADGSYDPSSTAMPTNGWREVATISLKEGNNNVEIDLSYDENNMFAYPTNFKKYIYQDRGKTFNAYHFVHIADLAAIYKFTKDRFFYKYCKKWITYMDEWPALECLLPKKYSYEHFLGGGYMENVQKMLKKEIIENECVVCGECLTGKEDRGICSSCKCRPRVRTIVDLFQSNIIPEFGNIINFSGANLCFAMTSHERTLLSKYYNRFESVSLFGKYGNEHTEGVDARDLSRFEDGSFSTHYSCLLFDYFVEHEAALKEAYRVLAFNGMFVTHIERPRILDDSSAPFSTASIKPRKGYYEYIPDSEGMLSVKVGKDWFLNTMKKIGFKSFVYTILDRASGVISDWFVGYKIDQFLPEKYNVKLIHEASKNIHKKKKDILVPAKKNVSKKEKSITSKTLKEYSIPLPNGHPSKHITIRLSIPEVTKTKKYVRFSEHSIDLNTGVASNRVIACSVGGFFISENLGDTWNWVSLEGYKKVKFINSFTLPDDSICLQSIGASLGGDLKEQPSAELIVCNANGKIYTKSTLGASSWHGSSSVDFRDGTLIFADYAINKPRTHGVQDRFDSNVFRSVD